MTSPGLLDPPFPVGMGDDEFLVLLARYEAHHAQKLDLLLAVVHHRQVLGQWSVIQPEIKCKLNIRYENLGTFTYILTLIQFT